MMLKVIREGDAYKVTEVTDMDTIQSVIDGTTDPDDAAIYLSHQDDQVEFSDLDSETIDAILNYLEDEGLLGILDAIYDDTKTEDDKYPSVVGKTTKDIDAIYNPNSKLEDYVFPVSTRQRGSKITSLSDQGMVDTVLPSNETDVIESPTEFAQAVKDAELSKEDKVEILQAAAGDLIDAIEAVATEARLMAETFDEILDPTSHKARNAMGRLLEAVGADFTSSKGVGEDAEVAFTMQPHQVDLVTEATMWAAAAIIETET